LILASCWGREDTVRTLLARGARQGMQNSVGQAALYKAAIQGRAGVVELLCAAPGAPVNVQDRNGYSPLIAATIRGREGIVRTLLARGAQQELQSSNGFTAMHHVAQRGFAGVAELLCAAPGAAAALSSRDRDGLTPPAVANVYACKAVLCACVAS
jgi:ankyrin repeat protein